MSDDETSQQPDPEREADPEEKAAVSSESMFQPDAPEEAASTPNEPSRVKPCPHCQQLVPASVRRCPHCGRLLAGKKITRPEKVFAEEAGPAWEDAAQRVTELGGLEWETGVHPINEDTHPLGGTASFADEPPTTPRASAHAAERGHARLWLLVASIGALMVVLAGFGMFAFQHQTLSDASSISARATYEASKLGNSTTPPGGKDNYTPLPGGGSPGPGQPTSTVHPHPTHAPNATPTAVVVGPSASPTPTPLPTATPAPQLVLAINSGGGAAGNYSADMDVSGGSTYGTTAQIDTSAVSDPAPQAVYDTERYGQFTYTLGNLQPGAPYLVRLHFAEIYFSRPKQRIFNVVLNNVMVLQNFDIVAQAGGPDKAIVEAFQTTADPNGVITINFIPTNVNWPKLSGLELYAVP